MQKVLKHIGTPRHSGRYPWGSGDDPQRNLSFRNHVLSLRKQGISQVDIAKSMGVNTQQVRNKMSLEKAAEWQSQSARAVRLHDKGYSNVKIGEIMGGINESSVRNFLNTTMQERSNMTGATANIIKEAVAKKKYVDVGIGVERHIGVSRTRLKTAIELLKQEGYPVYYIPVRQLGTGHDTSMMVIAKPGATKSEVRKNKDNIKLITDYSEDSGRSFRSIEPIKNVDSKRVLIRHGDEGGRLKDGVIELRNGVEDISLGTKRYAQVRIGVDGTHYMKGMAIYADSEDFPKGVDIIYNTNKKKGTPKEEVFKKQKLIEIDSDNPFGSTIRQRHYIDKNGKEQLSALNIVGSKEGAGEEGSWGKWSKTLSSQVLSKQLPALAKKQLGIRYDIKKDEFNDIMSYTNPVVQKKLLESFADECDSEAVHLKAAALPRQQSHVILPLTKIKESEVYAPNYDNGTKVALIRYPHAGTFEIPELIVNNKNLAGKRMLGQSVDGIGIHPNVAERLSGADFDGDSVLVIPNNKGLIGTSPGLTSLKGFDPRSEYRSYPGMPVMTKRIKGIEMGNVSNLITDMTIRGAPQDKIARAVKHSMVVIDAEKHELDYKRSFVENGIAELKKEFQGGAQRGASTLISKASSDIRVNERNITRNTKRMTPEELANYKSGRQVYKYTGKTYSQFYKTSMEKDVDGKVRKVTKKVPYHEGIENEPDTIIKTAFKKIPSTRMHEHDDAFELSSGTLMETVYAEHANKLKAMARDARVAAMNTPTIHQSPSAKVTYAKEVATLKARLNIALKNAPLERQAMVIGNANVKAKTAAHPDMDSDELKKLKNRELEDARARVGAKKQKIEINDREWEAMQSGAFSNNVLAQIIANADAKRIKELATPRTIKTVTPAKKAQVKRMLARGYTQIEIAEQLGLSTTMINSIQSE